MKDLWKNGIVVLLVIAGLYIIFLRECKHETCPPKGQVLVNKSVWDSIQALANKPPVIRVDTVKIVEPQKHENHAKLEGVVNKKDTSVTTYQDSLKYDDIDVNIEVNVKGRLMGVNWWYRPIKYRIDSTIIKYVPKIVDNPVPIPKVGFFAYTVVGGNKDMFTYGAGLDFITKRNTQIGYMYQRWGNVNVHSIKLGIKLGR